MTSPSSPGDLAIPFAASPFLEAELNSLSPRERDLVRSFAERGFVIVDLDAGDLDPLGSKIIAGLGDRYPEKDRRIENAWYFQSEVRELAALPAVLGLLRLLFGRRPIPFQTINFDAGTEQAAHSDALHFHCVPRQFMAGVWIALEDTDESNGTLFAYPGSHKLPEYDMTTLGLDPTWADYGEYEKRLARILDTSGIERENLQVKRGQAVVWAANLIHGGMAIADSTRTRHSQVTHYYFEKGAYYYPMGSEPIAGKVTLREVIDIGTGRFVPHLHNGKQIRLQEQPYVWSYPRPLPDWVEIPAGAEYAPNAEDDEDLSLRVYTLQQTVEELRGRFAKAQAHNRIKDAETVRVRADNRAKDAFIRARDNELAYKIARRITKTYHSLTSHLPD